MARSIEGILAAMRAGPKGIRFADACKVVTRYFGAPRQRGTSHKVWKTPWPGDPRVNLQQGEKGMAKPYQIRQIVAAIDVLLAMRAPARPSLDRASSPTSGGRKRRR